MGPGLTGTFSRKPLFLNLAHTCPISEGELKVYVSDFEGLHPQNGLKVTYSATKTCSHFTTSSRSDRGEEWANSARATVSEPRASKSS